MNFRVKEWLGTFIILAGLIGLPWWVLAYNRSLDPQDRKVIHLTGVMKDGVWTEQTVNSVNYGSRKFEAAELHFDKGERVLLKLTSADVTHGFYVPELSLGPVEVEPGHVVELAFDADTTGTFTYYCTIVCGHCHHFMRGLIHIGPVAETMDPLTMPPGQSCPKHVASAAAATSLVDRGRALFTSTGCTACHNESGRGGIRNPNYIKQAVPALDSLAERMYLFDREEVETIVDLLEQDTDLAALGEDPPFRRYNRFLAQYGSVRGVIQDGKPAGYLDSTLAAPPLHMPAWDAVLERRDVDAIIAYLLTEYPWEED